MTMTPQNERKLIEEVRVLTGERGNGDNRAVLLKELVGAKNMTAEQRLGLVSLRTDIDHLADQVEDLEDRVGDLEAGGGSGGLFTIDGNDIEGEGGLLYFDLDR